MTYTKEELWVVLENSNVILKTKTGYIINDIFKRTILGSNRSNFCLNYPSIFTGLSDVIIYKKVMEDIKVPLMVKGDFSYFARTQTKEAVKILKTIPKHPDIDYQIFINSSKNFYSSGISVPGFAKFLVDNTWETVYGTRAEEESSSIKGVI